MMVKYNQDPNANVLMTTLVERMTDKEKLLLRRILPVLTTNITTPLQIRRNRMINLNPTMFESKS